jgi:hypothetical protein
MANDKKNGGDAAADTAAQPAKETAKADLVTEIGTLTYPRAVAAFGKDNALSVMRQVAEIGGHGMFEDAHFLSPLFGGLGMPDPEKVIKPQKEDFDHLPEGEFYFQAAMEDFAGLQKTAAGNREKINELFNSFKK